MYSVTTDGKASFNLNSPTWYFYVQHFSNLDFSQTEGGSVKRKRKKNQAYL